MSDEESRGDDADGGAEPPDADAIAETLTGIRERLEALEAELEAAETEADLDEVEAGVEPLREELDDVEIPDPPEEDDEDEDAVDPFEEVRGSKADLDDDLDDVESGIEDQRGPYAEDVIAEVEDAAAEIDGTRWAEEGEVELRDVVEETVAAVDETLGTSIALVDEEGLPEDLVATLERVEAEVEEATLDPDEDAATIATLLETTDELASGVDDATAWTDLEVREQLRREGFYDVLDHVKDFPPEWHALKVHEKRDNVDMVLLALESFDSGFMEEHCLEALRRMGREEAIDPMLQRATRRDQDAIAILGAIGVENDRIVDTLLDYVDAGDLGLRTTTFRALGEIGTEEAVQPIANQLVADDATVRSHAARALGLIGDTRAIAPLADVLADDEDDTVRASAAWALNCIGTEEALESVASYADDRAYLVQAEAERAT